uniref:ATP synthase subunit 8 n=1 Tax=Ruditapes philippinarum TaxID=129788 RepID=A0A8A5N1A1_RUDPH|nr:ATP synthase subunit 8 [Ruditapes philippinarum]UUA63011.1 ATP synthase subunit 8 [Ruditapes philippinarum]
MNLPQFAPIFFSFLFIMIWLDFVVKMCLLWWSCKRSYNF